MPPNDFSIIESELQRYSPNPDVEIEAENGWVLPNRIKFPSFVASTFRYRSPAKNMFVNQRFIKDYMQYNSPYRGILVMHALGTGKTCSSIIAAENLMTNMGIVVMLPASLRTNYIGDIRTRCGNKYLTIRQRFKFIPLSSIISNITEVSEMTFVPRKFILKNSGLWIPIQSNATNSGNYGDFDEDTRSRIAEQLDEIIQTKYKFIHYNGITSKRLVQMEEDNPFHDKVVVIDEVHNFISRTIGNGKIGKRVYELLIKAKNCRIIALSGTPIINHPFEVSVLINLLAGTQTIYSLTSKNLIELSQKLEAHPRVDSFEMDVSKKQAHVQLLPEQFSFSKKSQAFVKKSDATLSNKETIDQICTDNGCSIHATKNFLLLPINEEDFVKKFVDMSSHSVINERMLAKRMMGLISYYGKYDEETYPTLLPVKMVYLNMPETMFGVYESNRIKEIQLEKKLRKNKARAAQGGADALAKLSQVYRVYSRTACNFAFPSDIKRPFPTNLKAMTNELSQAEDDQSTDNGNHVESSPYAKQIEKALVKLTEGADIYLSIKNLQENLSPKFASVIKLCNMCKGKVLVYSQFRVVEGLGVLSLALEENGWSEVRLRKQSSNTWEVVCKDLSKQKFFQYRGNNEETAMLMNIFNSNLQNIDPDMVRQLGGGETDNLHGSFLKMVMITQSGAEGISLKHVRQVHVLEPYWNEIRINQVIGRAVRANSHADLPRAERNVQVYRYIMRLPVELAKRSKEMFMQDDINSTDEIIFGIAARKAKIVNSIEEVMKAAAVDCMFHKKDHPKVECLRFPVNADQNALAYTADIEKDETDAEFEQRVKVEKVEGRFRDCKYKGIHYAFKDDSQTLYDLEAYKQGKFLQLGRLVKQDDKWKIVKKP